MSAVQEEAEVKFANAMPKVVQDQYDEAMKLVTPAPAEEPAAAAPAPGNDGTQPTPAAPTPAPAAATTPPPAPVAPTAQPVPSPSPIEDEPLEVWKQRAKVFQGRLAAQAHLNAELRAAQARIAELEQRQNAAGHPPAANGQPVQQAVTTPVQTRIVKAKEITDDEVKQEYDAQSIEDYGMDFLKNQIARERTMAARLEAKLASGRVGSNGNAGLDAERQELRELIEKQRDDKFFADLTQMCPSWEQLTGHAQFAEFEAAVEPRSGIHYGQLIRQARAAGDALRVLNILDDFRAHVNGPAPQQQPTTPSPAQPHVVKILPSVSEQASVTGGVPAGPSTAAPKRVYSVEQFSDLQKQIALLSGENKTDEANNLYNELLSAVQEGRVQGTVG